MSAPAVGQGAEKGVAKAKTKPRTPEEIRDAARAELPALRELGGRLQALTDELRDTPAHRSRRMLEDDDAEARPFAAMWEMAGSLSEAADEVRQRADDLAGTLDSEAWSAGDDDREAARERTLPAWMLPGREARPALQARMLQGLRELVRRIEDDPEAGWATLTHGASCGGVGVGSVEEIFAYIFGGEDYDQLGAVLPNFVTVYVPVATWSKLASAEGREREADRIIGKARSRYRADPQAFTAALLARPSMDRFFNARPLFDALEAPEGYAVALGDSEWSWLNDVAEIMEETSKRAGAGRANIGPGDVLELLVDADREGHPLMRARGGEGH